MMYFYSGPEGHFYVKNMEDGERILSLMNVDEEDWTATEVDHEVMVPVKADIALLASMAMRYRHDFGLLDKRAQESLTSTMRQIHEEVVGKGFYSREQRERYLQMMEKQNA